MQYRPLGTTDLQVSVICLGTMTWGEQNTQDEAFAQLDYALEQGVNFLDTAEMYPVPPRAETYTRTETLIGQYFQARGNRDRWVLATKAVGPGFDYVRGGKARHNESHLRQAVEGSLRRLHTETLDLYQLHWPERRANYFGRLGYVPDPMVDAAATPLEETLEALDKLVQEGKIRHVGLSNETPWGTMRLLQLAESRGWPRMVSVQNPYSLLNRSYEVGMAEISYRERCGLLAYSPLAFGVLSGKYLGGQRPGGARLTLFERFKRYTGDAAERATAAYVALARQHGLDPAQMALAWCNSRPFLTSTIIGATTLDQLKSNIASIDLTLSEAVLEGIEAIHDAHPYPCP